MNIDDKAFLTLKSRYLQNKSLSEKDVEIMDRWQVAHELMVNEFRVGDDLIRELKKRYPDLSLRTLRYDISNAKNFYMGEETIDKNFWRGMLVKWQLKGLQLSYTANDTKEFNTGIRNLYLILGLNRTESKIPPSVLKFSVNNFFMDPKKAGLPTVEDADIIELVDSFEDLTQDQRTKLLSDAGIRHTP